MAEYRLSPKARSDLDDIFDHTVANWGLPQALRYTELVEAALIELANAPYTAQACGHIRRDYRRRGVGRHMIYFRPIAEGIAVIRILHRRMDAIQHL